MAAALKLDSSGRFFFALLFDVLLFCPILRVLLIYFHFSAMVFEDRLAAPDRGLGTSFINHE